MANDSRSFGLDCVSMAGTSGLDLSTFGPVIPAERDVRFGRGFVDATAIACVNGGSSALSFASFSLHSLNFVVASLVLLNVRPGIAEENAAVMRSRCLGVRFAGSMSRSFAELSTIARMLVTMKSHSMSTPGFS